MIILTTMEYWQYRSFIYIAARKEFTAEVTMVIRITAGNHDKYSRL